MTKSIRQCTIRGPVDICRAMQITKIEAARAGFNERQITLMQLATEEACTNACEYASADTTQPIIVTWRKQYLSFIITVRQTGHPFTLATEDAEVNQAARGRGLQLIKHTMDEVQLWVRKPYYYLRMIKSIRRSESPALPEEDGT